MKFFGNMFSTALGVTVGGLLLVKIVTSKDAIEEFQKIMEGKLQEQIKKGIKIVFNDTEE